MDNKQYITIENARIFSRNFQGLPTAYNPRGGQRTCCVALTPDMAQSLMEQGFNVKVSKPREGYEDQGDAYYLPLEIKFEPVPPKVFLITNGIRKILDEKTVKCLDYANITRVDLTINPYHWEVNGNHGVKAYIKTLAVTQLVDPIEEMYYDIPESAANTEA